MNVPIGLPLAFHLFIYERPHWPSVPIGLPLAFKPKKPILRPNNYDRKIGLDPNISTSYNNLIFHTFSEFLFFLNLYFFINMSKICITF